MRKLYWVEWVDPTSDKWHLEDVFLTEFERTKVLKFFKENMKDFSVEPTTTQPIFGFDDLAMRYGWGK